MVALLSVGACAGDVAARSERVDALVARYAPSLRLGDSAVPLSDGAPTLAPARPASDGFRIVSIDVRASWRERIAHALSMETRTGRGVITTITLRTSDSTAVAPTIARIATAFRTPPRYGCAGIDGVALDDVRSWIDGSSAWVAVRTPERSIHVTEPVGDLIFSTGEWDPDNIEFGYHDGACPATRQPRQER